MVWCDWRVESFQMGDMNENDKVINYWSEREGKKPQEKWESEAIALVPSGKWEIKADK